MGWIKADLMRLHCVATRRTIDPREIREHTEDIDRA